MSCKHEHIQTWRFEDGQPAMWSCVDCAAKFEPIKGWMEQVERKDALLRRALGALELYKAYGWPDRNGVIPAITSELAK